MVSKSCVPDHDSTDRGNKTDYFKLEVSLLSLLRYLLYLRLTSSEDLSQQTMFVLSIDVVRCLSGFIRTIKKAGVFRVPQQKLADSSVSAPYSDMNRGISSLARNNPESRVSSVEYKICVQELFLLLWINSVMRKWRSLRLKPDLNTRIIGRCCWIYLLPRMPARTA